MICYLRLVWNLLILSEMGLSIDLKGFTPNSKITNLAVLLLTLFIKLSKLVS